jgi:iron complex transport system substrate-binding protein
MGANTPWLAFAFLCSQLMPAEAAPKRLVSLDACADALLLEQAPRRAIIALSTESQLPSAPRAKQARGLPQIRPDIEHIVRARPDLVVRGYGGSGALALQLQRLSIPLLQLDGEESLAAVNRNRVALARVLGQPSPPSLTDLPKSAGSARILYLTPSGFTAGHDTHVDDLIRAAGGRNIMAHKQGYFELDAERLMTLKPDLIVYGFADFAAHGQGRWSLSRHPVLTRQLRTVPVLHWASALLACPGAGSLKAAAQLRARLGMMP